MSEIGQLDRFFEALGRISELAQIRDLKREADLTDRRRCGNCQHWMKSRECPQERNVGGMSRGPGCEGVPCSNFALQPWVEELKAKRLAEVEARLAKATKQS